MSYLLRLFTFKITITLCGKYLHFTAGKKRQNIKIGQIEKSFSFTQQKNTFALLLL